MAIRGLLLIAAAGALLAGALATWRTLPLASSTIGPLGATLLSLGIGLLNHVYWYAYQQGHNGVSEHARQATNIIRFIRWEIVVSLGTLAVQVLGAALVMTVGWPGWQLYGLNAYLLPLGLCFTVNMATFMLGGVIKWQPTRAPDAPALSAEPGGVRLLLRWVVMGFARTSVLLLIPPFLALSTGDLQLSHGSTDTSVALLPGVADTSVAAAVTIFGVAAAFFLLAALSELTTFRRAPAPETP